LKQERLISAFAQLGDLINESLNNVESEWYQEIRQCIQLSEAHNPWFTVQNQIDAINGIVLMLKNESLMQWIQNYTIPEVNNPKKVLVVMAGNIPMVNFHDFICVLVSRNLFFGKLSSQDKYWLPLIAKMLVSIAPEYSDKIKFTEGIVKEDLDAVIATGSDNSARYFDYYFAKYPNIIRKNRNSIAILTGTETDEELKALCKDIFLFYGLGCRNISKIMVPQDYDFMPLLYNLETYPFNPVENKKYLNNYEYRKSVYLLNQTPHFDTGNLLIKEDASLNSMIATLHYEFYKDLNALELPEPEKIQCIASNIENKSFVKFGETQSPGLLDYPDGIDILAFLLSLN
jgi:hypothetical protein